MVNPLVQRRTLALTSCPVLRCTRAHQSLLNQLTPELTPVKRATPRFLVKSFVISKLGR